MKIFKKLFCLLTAAVIMLTSTCPVTVSAAAFRPSSGEKTGFVMVGDSRTYRMRKEIASAESAKSSWACLSGSGYAWFSDTGLQETEKLITPGCSVIIMMGVNDTIYENPLTYVEGYANLINSKAKEWSTSWGVKTYFVSVNPVDEAQLAVNTAHPEYRERYSNAKIKAFNAAIRSLLSNVYVTYIDSYNYVDSIKVLPDGLHYSGAVSQKIYAFIKNAVKKKSGAYHAPTLAEVKVTGLVTPVKYEGKAVTQNLTLTYKGKTLNKGYDYSLTYANNNKAGLASVKITLSGNYSGTVTKYFEILSAADSQTVELYQFYSAKAGDHFYTIDKAERDSLIASYKAGRGTYKYMGVSGTVETAATSTNTAVYRFYNSVKKDHFYTTDRAERNEIISKYNAGKMRYLYEGIAWYTAKSSENPMYRFYSSKWQDHYYTIDEKEKNEIIAKYKLNRITYAYEGIAWYY